MTIQTTYPEASICLDRLIYEVASHREIVIIRRSWNEPGLRTDEGSYQHSAARNVALISVADLEQLMKNVRPLRSPQSLQRHLSQHGWSPAGEATPQSPDDLRRSLFS